MQGLIVGDGGKAGLGQGTGGVQRGKGTGVERVTGALGVPFTADLRRLVVFVQDEWLAEAGKKSPAAKQALDEYRGLITSVSRELGVSK